MNDKGIFLWQSDKVDDIVGKLTAGNFGRVDLKVADEMYIFRKNDRPELVKDLQAKGIKVYGYGFCYGYYPREEGYRGAERVQALGLDGYIFNVETSFENFSDCVNRGRILASSFREGQPNIELALCTWPLFNNPKTGGRWHNKDLAVELMKYCDVAMPMCYWGYYGSTAAQAVYWLEQAHEQWRRFTNKPFIPIGRAYVDSWETVILYDEAVKAFAKRVREMGLKGESWWELGWVTEKRPEIWETLKGLDTFGETPQPEPEKPIYQISVPANVGDFIIEVNRT